MNLKSLRAPRLSLALLALAPVSSLAIAPAAAQTPATSTLTDVQLIAEGENQSVFQLSLSPRAGSYDVRIRYTPYWALASAHGCVSEARGGFTRARTHAAVRLRIIIAFSFSRIFDHGARCR